jgi:hypothetical protein
MAKNYTVYLSSTLNDLAEEREAVKQALLPHCSIKESYTAVETNLVASCREDVESCDLYIGIVGLRYGYIPPTDWNPQKKSITEIEYDHAASKNVPRLIFIKSKSSIVASMTDMDAKEHTNEHPGERIEQFRRRVSNGLRPAEFKTAADLKSAVLDAFFGFKYRPQGDSALLQARQSPARTLRSDIAIACVRGTDDASADAIRRLNDTRFQVLELGPNDPVYLETLDKGLRSARVGCLLVTKASIGRLIASSDGEFKIAAALKMMDERTLQQQQRSAFLALDGIDSGDIPENWRIGRIVKFEADSFKNKPRESLDTLFSTIRAETTVIASDTLVGLPYIVLALKQDEATWMKGQPEEAFAGFPEGGMQRKLREEQFTKIQALLAQSYGSWPAHCYGDRRDNWRPLGPGSPTAQQLLQRVVDRINQTMPGSRERRTLGNAKLRLQRYTFDEFLDDQFGSRANLEEIRDSGCLVLVDEVALLHPALRKEAETFLSGARTAVVSISPFDPAYSSTSELLDDLSALKVGTLFDRFRVAQDPRCELALNSIERVERWLRLVMPELVASKDDLETRPELVAQAGELFS